MVTYTSYSPTRRVLTLNYRHQKRKSGRDIPIENWLCALGIPQYFPLFHQYGGVQELIYCTEADIKDIGIGRIDHCTRLASSLRTLRHRYEEDLAFAMTTTLFKCLFNVMFLAIVSPVTLPRERTTFKAAVYEHALVAPPLTSSPVSRAEALRHMQANLDVYRTQAVRAKQLDSDIVVFPENGLYGYNFTRQTIRPYLEYIPDPDRLSWSACDDPDRFPNTDVQRQLSCMAKDNSLYLVANMGDVQQCNASTELHCPKDGVFHFNTAVAYDPRGKLVARYHKRNLFHEDQFDRPEAEVKYFDTPFGRFGLFVCFDVLYERPAIDMVKAYKIGNVVFPTAWMDSLPFLSAIGWHSSFARGQRVNVLAANLHLPMIRVQGSGVYSPNGMEAIYYDSLPNSGPKLIVTEIGVIDATSSSEQDSENQSEKPISIWDDHGNRPSQPYTQGTFENKNFSLVPLTNNSGKAKVCRNTVCCALDYSFYSRPLTDLVVLGAFDGLYHHKYYSKICAVLKCPRNDRNACGSYTFLSESFLARAKLQAFHAFGSSRTVFPQVVVSTHGQLTLTEASAWSWSLDDMTLNLEEPLESPLLTMAIITREYWKDPESH